MAMLALAIGDDAISSRARREAIIDGLFDLPSMFHLEPYFNRCLDYKGLFLLQMSTFMKV